MVRNLSQLQEMTVSDCQNMEEIVIDQSGVGEDNIEVAEFSQLRSLKLIDLPLLKSFCIKVKESMSDEVHNPRPLFDKMVSFPNLEEFYVESIELKYLFTTSFVKSLLRLKSLQIENCGFMERIVLTEEFAEEERLDKIIFSDLENLTLWDLPNLTSFCDGNLIEFCSLTNLQIRNCPVFKTFVSNRLSQSLFDEKVAFSSLEHLSISRMSNLERIWHNQLAGGSFCMLKSMTVEDCKNLHTLFPSNDLRRFQKLEQLNLMNCDSLEEIYQLPEFNAEEESFAIDLNLRSMEIRDMKKLKHIWNKDLQGIFTFRNLDSIEVTQCKVLKNLFPASVAQNLLLLEKLSVDSCGVETIVAKAEGAKAAPSFVFPKLLSLNLTNQQDIRRFYPGIHSLEFPKLKDLEVHDCGNGMEFCSDLFSLQGKHGEERHHITIQQLLHLEKKVFPNLEELSLDGQMIEMILQCQLPKGFLSKVKSVELSYIRGKSNVALFGFLQRLPNLETVYVKDSSLQEFVFQCEDYGGAMLPQIRKLNLDLHDLKHIWKPHPQMDLVLQNLQTMDVRRCYNLISLAPSSASFQNLTALAVYSCKVLKHLVTPSTAKSMVQLVTMEIRACEMLTEIVVDEQNGTPEEIEFGKLKTLQLIDLESLTSFCFGGFTFKFPCLEVVTVERCPNMRTFSAGVLSTPKLQCVQSREIHFQEWLWEGDLNATIRQLYTEMDGFFIFEDGFNSIKKFILSKFPHIKEKWHTQLPLKLLDGLSELVVDNCEYFSKALSSNQLQFLNRLEVLIVEKCDSLEEIFDLEGMNAVERHDKLMWQLKELHLIDLPKLGCIWNKDPQGILDFKYLRLLKVHNCSSLGVIVEGSKETCEGCFDAPIVPIFSGKIAIQMLEELKVEWNILKEKWQEIFEAGFLRCLKVIELVGFPGGCALLPLDFLQRLPNIEMLVLSDSSTEEIFLDELNMHDEENTGSLAQLKVLKLSNLTKLKRTVEENSQPVQVFEHLATLEVSECYTLKILVPSSVSFQNLTNLELSKCHGMINLITSLVGRGMMQLNRMIVKDCEIIQEIVASGGDGVVDEICFSQLKYLDLRCLPCLTSFCFGYYTFNFPSLEKVIVIECPKMKIFAQGVLSTPKLRQIQIVDEVDDESALGWHWKGSLNKTIQDLFIEMDDEENEAIFHFDKAGTRRKIFNEVREIVADEGDGEVEEIEFNKLKTLELIHLKNLTIVYGNGWI
ncbi:hypothetical protein GH714_004631 [Hevea brasiliensis]|uniref:Disease resistance protein At4g27190-like leucine-rich repeats domain-containing protein n=1 Tax=Hevea brasiliensis TaxID=3981 RepID=A0A6A6N151_HEVBR|nr:hypothetical protein GH714_004631 [Hevea brasiliensis]